MKILTQIARVLVGALFIFSGFIKAIDPIGFSYKLDEYFQVFGDKIWEPLADLGALTIFMAVFITGLEILLGFILLTGSYIKLNRWLLLLLIVFFTFLTFYSAYTGYIKECGCFGDVIPLKAWQSFYKDLILLVLILIIFFGHKHIQPLVRKPMFDNLLVGLFIVISFGIPVYSYLYLPLIDLGQFKPGTDIMAERKKYMDEQQEKIKNMKWIYKNKASGQIIKMSTDEMNLAYQKDTLFYEKHEYVKKEELDSVDTRLLPLAVGIDMMDENNNNITDSIIGNPNYQFVLFVIDVEKAPTSAMNEINDLAQLAEKDGVSFVGLTHSDKTLTENFRHKNQTAFPFYHASDDTPMKGAIRSSPGLILFKNGVVVKKWHWRSIPTYSDVKEGIMKSYVAPEKKAAPADSTKK